MVLQQSFADLNAAYRNFFASLTGEPQGPARSGRPGSGLARTGGKPPGSPRNAQFKISARAGGCASRRSETWRSAGRAACRPRRPVVTVIKDPAGPVLRQLRRLRQTRRRCRTLPVGGFRGRHRLGPDRFRCPVGRDGRSPVAEVPAPRRAQTQARHSEPLSRKAKGSNNKEKVAGPGWPACTPRSPKRRRDCLPQIIHPRSSAKPSGVRGGPVRGRASPDPAGQVRRTMPGWSGVHCDAGVQGPPGTAGSFAKIGRFEPTSQVCSACGVKDGPKPLSVRAWTCAACGTVHDRDVNAARNVLALGRRESLNARRGQVRPAPMLAPAGEAGSRRGAT